MDVRLCVYVNIWKNVSFVSDVDVFLAQVPRIYESFGFHSLLMWQAGFLVVFKNQANSSTLYASHWIKVE